MSASVTLRPLAPQVVDYMPKPNSTGLATHPLVREALKEERQEKLALNKKLGICPPRKGEGKRASKKK